MRDATEQAEQNPLAARIEYASPTPGVSNKMLWAGRIVSAIPVLMLFFSAAMKFAKPAAVVEGFTHMGYPDRLALPLGIVELACTLLYIIPRTSVLGAILLTGYLGGAIATHVRIGEPFLFPIIFGVLIWLGLYLRDAWLRDLVPLRRLIASRVHQSEHLWPSE